MVFRHQPNARPPASRGRASRRRALTGGAYSALRSSRGDRAWAGDGNGSRLRLPENPRCGPALPLRIGVEPRGGRRGHPGRRAPPPRPVLGSHPRGALQSGHARYMRAGKACERHPLLLPLRRRTPTARATVSMPTQTRHSPRSGQASASLAPSSSSCPFRSRAACWRFVTVGTRRY